MSTFIIPKQFNWEEYKMAVRVINPQKCVVCPVRDICDMEECRLEDDEDD